MKTLDEVITALEICWEQKTCSKECPYMMQEPSCGLRRELDALYYLREYKAHQADWSYAVANSEQFAEARDKHIKALAEMKRNDPITWDELRQMKGKPVWIEEYWAPLDGEVDSEKYWAIIAYENERRIGVLSAKIRQGMLFETMGDVGNGTYRWQAFRKERE